MQLALCSIKQRTVKRIWYGVIPPCSRKGEGVNGHSAYRQPQRGLKRMGYSSESLLTLSTNGEYHVILKRGSNH